jgi:hypothetical protein
LRAGSGFENEDPDSLEVVVKSQPLPLSSGRTQENPDVEDEDAIMGETNELDDTTRDPTWRPGQVTWNEETPDDNQGESRDGPRYNLRSRGRQNSEDSSETPPANENPDEQLEQPPLDPIGPDDNRDMEVGHDRELPYPYSLTPLPGRRIN